MPAPGIDLNRDLKCRWSADDPRRAVECSASAEGPLSPRSFTDSEMTSGGDISSRHAFLSNLYKI
jgi:hypothetical protein